MFSVKRILKRRALSLHQVPILEKSPLFDPNFYLSQYKDVADKEVSPYMHYLEYGANEGRNPSSEFNTSFYLQKYPDVKASGMNPLIHYVMYGKAEGRDPKQPSIPLSSSALFSGNSCVLILDHNLGGGTWRYIYSNLINTPFGRENTLLLARYNIQNKSFEVSVYNKGKVIEKASYFESDRFLSDINSAKFSSVIVNSLFSWPSTETILDFIANYKQIHPITRVEFMCHDYYCVCPSFTLMDYKHRYCGIKCDEIGCNDCVKRLGTQHTFIDEDNSDTFSVSHWRSMWGNFFAYSVDTIEIFSASSKKIFLQAYPDTLLKIKLLPHEIASFDCCHIAILGHSAIHKGSEVIKQFCNYLDENQIEDMKLYLFGWNTEGILSPHLKQMDAYERSDLPEILKKAGIDIVFIPSICPESFCYTAGESIALGYPTASFDIGGQADQVRESENGIILYSEYPDYLYDTFKQVYQNMTAAEKEDTQLNTNTQTRSVILQDTTGRDFLKWMYQQRDDKSHLIPESNDSILMSSNMPKIIAAYLPQYHDFPENIRWFGRGFSEWTNTSQTVPQFMGHRQPQVPIDVGYYNLNSTDIMYRQAELAKKYGVYGFAVYYYWFSGTKLMDQPLRRLLQDKDLDFPFFLFWANDDWTMCWGN